MPSPSPPLYSKKPRSEPSSSENDPDEEDDDGFIKRPRATRSPSPPSKRPRYDEQARPSTGRDERSNGSSGPSDHNVPKELSISILNVEPFDEFVREIGDFIWAKITEANVQGNVQIEVEAKLGFLRDRHTRERLLLPTMTETILPPNFDEYTFESNLSVEQHKHFNQLLNKLVTDPPPPSSPDTRTTRIKYEHLTLVDEFYSTNAKGREMVGREKIRVTRDEKTKRIVECIHKVRLGDLNVYSPKWRADWRVSVNLEIPESVPTGPPDSLRRKDRLSYTHETTRIDLTQVNMQTSPNSAPYLLHELELEMVPSSLIHSLASERGENFEGRLSFDEAVRVFVNNARILVKNA